MARYKLTKDAQADLIHIRQYTLMQWGSGQSERYLLALHQALILLSESPEIGKKRPDTLTDTLSFPHASHVVYYMVHNDHVLVFAILHKGMVPGSHLEDRGVD